MDKKKILFIVQLPPPIHGASLRNRVVFQHINKSNLFQLKLIDLKFNKKLDDIEKITFSKILISIKIIFQIFRSCLTNRYSLAYLTLSPQGVAFYRDLLFVTVLKLFKIPLLYHIRVLGIARYPKRELLYKFVFNRTNVICLSSTAANDVKPVFDDTPIIVNNGIIDPIKEYGLVRKDSFGKHLLFLSNLFISKGVFDLIEACRLLKDRNIRFKLTIVGDETSEVYLADLRSYILSEGLCDCIKVKGPLYGLKKFEVLMKADIFCFPSYYEKENFPGVILEAMSCSLPVVSYRHSSVPEMIHDGKEGLLVELRDIKGLAMALECLLLNSALREKIGNNARKLYEEKFTLEIFENNMMSVFQNLVLDK